MRILYGVSGDGFGHSSRTLVIADFLEKQGHQVKIVTYGRAVNVLKRFDLFRVSGMALVFSRGVLKKRKTLAHTARVVAKNLFSWNKFHKLMRDFKPDLCISDMEPIVPILSYWYKLPLICVDNQHRITNLQLDVPKKYYKDYLMAKAVVNRFVARAEHFIVTSFATAKIKRKNTTIVPPIIRPDVLKLKPKYGSRILVYLTRKNTGIINILKRFDEKFVVFGYNINKKDKNLEYRTKNHFLEELGKCRAIIATAGFTLMSEALYLKKPYLALPLKGQFEQVLNSLFLKKAGYGDYSDDLTYTEVKDFLENIENYRKKLKSYKLDFNKLPRTLKKVIK